MCWVWIIVSSDDLNFCRHLVETKWHYSSTGSDLFLWNRENYTNHKPTWYVRLFFWLLKTWNNFWGFIWQPCTKMKLLQVHLFCFFNTKTNVFCTHQYESQPFILRSICSGDSSSVNILSIYIEQITAKKIKPIKTSYCRGKRWTFNQTEPIIKKD